MKAFIKTIGILGSGQLGQMMTMAAKKMGYRVIIYDAIPEGPAVSVADESIVAAFNDKEALRKFAESVDLITLEFENIPLSTLTFLSDLRPLSPSADVVRICQERMLEKNFLKAHDFPVGPFYEVTSLQSLEEGFTKLGKVPCILKTVVLGYDGKGQVTVTDKDDLAACWALLKTDRAILEKRINFLGEASVIVARSANGERCCFPMQENIHRHGILDFSIAPARFHDDVRAKGEAIAQAVAEALKVVGLIAVEFFVLADGSLLINELAPRPHNSGHHTMESSATSQFEQVIRAVCGLPFGSPELLKPAFMVNLLGDLWMEGDPDWTTLVAHPDVALHLYGKKEAKLGRKMGHFTVTSQFELEPLSAARKPESHENHY